jgi:hypothetical protein
MEPNEKIPFAKRMTALLRNKRFLLVAAICIVAAIAITALIVFLPRGERTVATDPRKTPKPTQPALVGSIANEVIKPFELVPEDVQDNGVGTGAGYRIILSDYAYTPEELSEKIAITPETEFEIEKKSENNFILRPLTSLQPNKVYSFAFADENQGITYSWAFQTRNEFFVTSTLPRHQATFVPVNSGIEISFSQKELNDLSGYFEISPKVSGRFEIHKNTIVFVPDQPLEYDTIYTVTVKRGFSEPVSGMTLAEDRVFSFQTEPKPSAYEEYSCVYLSFARSIYNFYSPEVPLISVYTVLDENEPVNFSLYRYASEEEFK